MMCSARVATSSSWAGLRVRGAHAGDAAHARRVAELRTPATVGAEMALTNNSATRSRAWRRLIVSRLTACLLLPNGNLTINQLLVIGEPPSPPVSLSGSSPPDPLSLRERGNSRRPPSPERRGGQG